METHLNLYILTFVVLLVFFSYSTTIKTEKLALIDEINKPKVSDISQSTKKEAIKGNTKQSPLDNSFIDCRASDRFETALEAEQLIKKKSGSSHKIALKP